MKLIDKIAIGAMGVIIVTNPASGQVILDGLDVIFKLIFQYASPVNFVASVVVIVYISYKIWDGRDKVRVPAKTAKTAKARKFLEA